jgi:predicted ATPase
LAEAYGQTGQTTKGLTSVGQARDIMARTGEQTYAAEVSRCQGELLLRRPGTHAWGAAEACFQQALGIARRQQARLWELRAAMSLSRLWQQQGKQGKAAVLLAPIYGWFTEGVDTADLQEAKALLTELGT